KKDTATTRLFLAIQADNLQEVQKQVNKGANLESTYNGWSPMHIAVREDSLPIAKFLIASGANIDAQNQNGITPLHYAAASDGYEMVKLLLESGANYTLLTWDGETAKKFAKDRRSEEIVELIEEYENGPDIKEPEFD